MKRTVVFTCRKWNLGGGHLLLLRWAEQYTFEGYHVRILYQEIKDQYIKQEIIRLKIDCVKINDWWNEREWKCGLSIDGKIYVVTLSLNDYIRCVGIRFRNVKVALYLWDNYQYKIREDDDFAKLNYILTRWAIRDICKMGGIITADYYYSDCAIQYYKGLSDWGKNIRHVNIGIDIVDISDSSIWNRAVNRKKLKLLSIARAEFPFKGYLIGLINLLEVINTDYEIDVDIVSYGNSIDKLKKAYLERKFPANVNIKLHGKKDYTELKQFFSDCNLYIGMGTSILDAAQYGIPCIAVTPWTMKLIGRDFFSSSSPQLGFYKKGSEKDVLKSILEIMNLTDDAYYLLGKETRKTVLDMYDNKINARKIIDCFEAIPEKGISMAEYSMFLFRRYMHNRMVKRKGYTGGETHLYQ